MNRVAIVGMGYSGFYAPSPDLSFREMIFKAAQRAYEDAGNINPRRDVDAFISCQEDFWEGIAIANEFMPEQLGGVLKPGFTVPGDSLQCLLNAYAMIKTGQFNIVVVESHGKPSEINTLDSIVMFSYDPLYIRPIEPRNIYFLNAIEARAFMERENISKEVLGHYVVNSLKKGLKNPRASYARTKSLESYLNEEFIVEPLSESDIAPLTDAAVVAVVASEEIAKKLTDTPVWIDGIWTASGTSTAMYEDLSFDYVAREAGIKVFEASNIRNPRREIDVLEIDERFSYVPLMVLKALGISSNIKEDIESNVFDVSSEILLNPFGGALSEGNPLETHGITRVLIAYEQLKGLRRVRGARDPERILIHSRRWPFPRTTTIALLSR
jgi:acetyl-CoA C-acetyltransferase